MSCSISRSARIFFTLAFNVFLFASSNAQVTTPLSVNGPILNEITPSVSHSSEIRGIMNSKSSSSLFSPQSSAGGNVINHEYDFTSYVYDFYGNDMALGALTTTPDSTTVIIYSNGTPGYSFNHAVGAIYDFDYYGWGSNQFGPNDTIQIDSLFVIGGYDIFNGNSSDKIRFTIFHGPDSFNAPFNGVQYNAGIWSLLPSNVMPTAKTMAYSGSSSNGNAGGVTATNTTIIDYTLTTADSGIAVIGVEVPNGGMTMLGSELLGIFIEYLPDNSSTNDTINLQTNTGTINPFYFYYYREANTSNPKGYFIQDYDTSSTNCSNFLFNTTRYSAWSGTSNWRNDQTSINMSYSHLISVRASGVHLNGCVLSTTPYTTEQTFCFGDTISNSLYNDTSSLGLIWYSDSLTANGTTSLDTIMGSDTIELYVSYFDVDSCISPRTMVKFYPSGLATTYEYLQACGKVTYKGNAYTSDTILNLSLTDLYGCDSSHVVSIQVYPVFADTLSYQSCDGFIPYLNLRVLSDTTFTDTFTSVWGCDSSITVISEYEPLIILPISYDASNQIASVNATPQDSVVWSFNQSITTSSSISTINPGLYKVVTYNLLRCPGDTSYLSLTLTNDTNHIDVFDTTFIDVFDTNYVDVFDTIYIVQIDTVLLTVTDTLVIDVSMIGINPITFEYQLKVYPNPTNSILFIDVPQSMTSQLYTVEITNAIGQVVFGSILNQTQIQVNLSSFGSAGNYILRLKDSGGTEVQNRTIILQ